MTVSYFEWLKNLSHVRFGRMGKRYEQSMKRQMLKAIELASGKLFTELEQARMVHGAEELDLVNSGLEETMVVTYHEMLETRRRHSEMKNLRTAAFLNAIEKVAQAYLELGIFP